MIVKLASLALVFVLPVFACFADSVGTKSDQIAAIQKSLNQIKTMSAKIMQVDSKKDRASGLFYLVKPSDMRIDYKSKKSDIVMVAGSTMISYYDKDLDETSYALTKSTPAAILMQENIDFDDFEILGLENDNGIQKITFYRKGKKDEGIFTFTFKSGDSLLLQRIDRYENEDMSRRLSIFFSNVKVNEPIDNKVFDVKNKRIV